MEAKPHADQPPLPTKNLCKLVEILLRNARIKRERQNICYVDTLNPNASGSEEALQTPPERSSTNSVPGDGVEFPTIDLEARSSEHEEEAKLRFKGKTPSQVNLAELTKEFRALTVAQERESRQKEPVAGSVIPSEWRHKKVKCGDAELLDLAPYAESLTQQAAEASHGPLRGDLGMQNLSLRLSPPETKTRPSQTTPVQFTGGGYPSSFDARLQDATARGSFSEELRTKTPMAQETPSAAQYIGTPLLMTTAPKMQLVWVKGANNQMVLAQVPVANMPSSGTVVSGQPPIGSNLSAATATTSTALPSPEKVSWASMAASMAAVPPMECKQVWVKGANNQMVLAQVPVANMPSSGTVVSGQPPIGSNLSAATATTSTALPSPEKVSWASMAASMAAVPPMEYKQVWVKGANNQMVLAQVPVANMPSSGTVVSGQPPIGSNLSAATATTSTALPSPEKVSWASMAASMAAVPPMECKQVWVKGANNQMVLAQVPVANMPSSGTVVSGQPPIGSNLSAATATTSTALPSPEKVSWASMAASMAAVPPMEYKQVWVKGANNQMVLGQVPVANMPSSGTVVSGQPPIGSNLSAATTATSTALPSPEKVSWASMAASMAAVPPMEYKQMMGERLYPFIQRMYPDLAGKITGMLLEQDNKELLGLLASPDLLKKRVEEAVQVLKDGLCQVKQPLIPDLLASFPSHVQKQILEEHLFRRIYSLHSNNTVATKITDMLLVMDNKKLLHLLSNPELLKSEVEKTITTLHDALLETSSLSEDAEKMSLPVDELRTHSPSLDVLKTRSPSPDVTGAKMQTGDVSGRKVVTDDVLEALLMTWDASGSQPLTEDAPRTASPGEDSSRMPWRTNNPTVLGTQSPFDTIMGEKPVTSEFPGTGGLKSPTENVSGTQSQAEDVLGLKSLTERVAGIESLGQGISEKPSSSEDVLDRRSPSQNVSGTELLTDDVLGLKSLARNVSKTLSVNEDVEEKKVSIEDILEKQPLTENMLASLSAELQKKELRDRLLPLIERMHPQLGTEITALLLPLDNSSLLAMLDSHSLLETKVMEAVAVLQAQRTQQLLYLQQQKQILGQRLFTIIQPAYPQLAAHITGLLLEMDFNELLTILQVPNLLTQRVDQAVKTLQVHLVKDPLTADVLALFPAHVQKQILADRLLPRVQNYYPTQAGEIVRTLLASESWQLLQMLQYPLVLHATVDHIVRLMQAKGDAGSHASETAETKDPSLQSGRGKDAHQTDERETASSDRENDHPHKEGLGNDDQNIVHTPIKQPAADVEQTQNETVSETGNESSHLSDMSTNLTYTGLGNSTQQNAQVTGQNYSKFTPEDDMNVATDDAGVTERNDSKVQQEAENATTNDHVHATSNKDMQSDVVVTDTVTSSTQEGVVRLTPGDLMQSGMFAHHGMLPSTDVFTTVAYLQNQKQILGQRLFTIIQPAYPQLAAHITGFLLEMDYNELLTILQVPDLLTQRVDQAVRTLQAHLVKDPLTADVLALFPAAIQKQILGERLFSQIAKLHPELAGKITGMLLALDSKELIDMLQSPHALKGRVDEAIAVLIAYSAQDGHTKELAGVETPPVQHETTADACKLPAQKPGDLKESRKPAEGAREVEEDLSTATAGQRGSENEEPSASPDDSVKLSDIDEAYIDALTNPSKVEMDVRGTLETDVVFMEEDEKELLLDA